MNGDENDRAQAIYALGALGPSASAAVPYLLSLLEKQPDNLPGVADALGKIGVAGRRAAPALMRALVQSDDVYRAARISEALAGIGATEAVPDISRAYARYRPNSEIACALGKLSPSKSIVPTLIQALDSGDKEGRAAAAAGIACIGADAKLAIPALVRAITAIPGQAYMDGWAIRRAAAEALGAIGSEAVPAVLDLLASHDASTRYTGTIAVIRMGATAKPAIPLLIADLQTGEYGWRYSTAAALAAIGTEAVPMLVRTLDYADEDVRSEAVSALGMIGPGANSSVPALLAILQRDQGRVASVAAASLGRITPDENIMRVLRFKLRRGPSGIRAASAYGLSFKKPSTAATRNALLAALQDAEPYVRAAAADALGRLQPVDRAVITALTLNVRDEQDPEVWLRSIDALANIGPLAADAVPEITARQRQLPYSYDQNSRAREWRWRIERALRSISRRANLRCAAN